MKSTPDAVVRRWTASGMLLLATLAGGVQAAFGFATLGGAWHTGNIQMQLQLDATAPTNVALPLMDGSTSWNAVAQKAMGEWNKYLNRSQFTWTTSTTTSGKLGDGVNNVMFASTMYGQAFDSRTLAVTFVDNYDTDGLPTVQIHEADLLVNSNLSWNSYSGAVRQTPTDIHRVVLHELGHVLGLDHPDQASPPQTVASIMNSAISNLETIQQDDINGVTLLYGTALAKPVISPQPASQTASVTGSAALTIGVNGGNPPDPSPILSYTWFFKAIGAASYEKLFTVSSANLDFGSVQVSDAGSYYVQVMNPDYTLDTSATPATLTVNPVTTNANTTAVNISTRGIAGSGSSSMIVGFQVSGSRDVNILLRAVGPTLGAIGVPGSLGDPVLTLTNQNTHSVEATSPSVWDSNTTQAAALRSVFTQVGAFPLNAGSHDAVIRTTVHPGVPYTAVASSPSGNTGVVLIEAYNADNPRDPASRFVNLSTRGFVGDGSNIMIGGFVVDGPGPHTYLIRVSSTSLEAAPYNVTNTLPDPILTLFNGNDVAVRVDDDWDSPSTAQPALNAAFTAVGAFTWPYPSTVNGTRDPTATQSAMLVTLQPGKYTAQVSGNANQGTTATTGNALLEIYEVK